MGRVFVIGVGMTKVIKKYIVIFVYVYVYCVKFTIMSL